MIPAIAARMAASRLAARQAAKTATATAGRKTARGLTRTKYGARQVKRKGRNVIETGRKAADSPVGRKVLGAGSAAGGMMSAGAGFAGAATFGAASSLTGRLTNNLGTGLPVIIFALLVDLIAIDFVLKGSPYYLAVHAVVGALMYLFIMKRDPLALGILALNFLPLMITQLPSSEVTLVIANTIANPFIPWWFIYAGFLRNRREGKIASVIFWAFVLVFMAIGYHVGGDRIAEVAGDIGVGSGQREAAETAKEGVVNAVIKLGKDAFEGIKGIPNALFGGIWTNVKDPLGLDYIWGEPEKEQPKLGIVITKEDPAELGDKIIARATLNIIEPIPDGTFLTISEIECWHEEGQSGTEEYGKISGYREKDFQEGIKIYYGKPISVFCEFGEDQLDGVSSVKLAVRYHVYADAWLKTYFMKHEILEQLLISGEDPADYIGLNSRQRYPSTKYDNTPARFGIGPKELLTPPIGIKEDGRIGPGFFVLSVGNRGFEFNGKIARINSLQVTLPDGIRLNDTENDECVFQDENKDNVYSLNPKVIERKWGSFSDIESERIYICEMFVKNATAALQHAEAEFRVNADFDYEVGTTLSTRVR